MALPYQYELVAGMGYFGKPARLREAKAALPSLRLRHPNAEIERVLTLPTGGRRYWRWRRGRWRLWDARDDPSPADLAKWYSDASA